MTAATEAQRRLVILGKLFCLFPGAKGDSDLLRAYAEALDDVPAEDLANGCDALARVWSRASAPKPGDIRDAVRDARARAARYETTRGEGESAGPWVRLPDMARAMGLPSLAALVTLTDSERDAAVTAYERAVSDGHVTVYDRLPPPGYPDAGSRRSRPSDVDTVW